MVEEASSPTDGTVQQTSLPPTTTTTSVTTNKNSVSQPPPPQVDTNTNSSQSSSSAAIATSTTTNKSVHLVFQRFRKCRLLLNEDRVVHVGGRGDSSDILGEDDSLLLNPSNSGPTSTASESSPTTVGLLVYVSFAATADEKKVLQAAKTVLNLPILTLGTWGDGSSTKSLLQLAGTLDAEQQQQNKKETTNTTHTEKKNHNIPTTADSEEKLSSSSSVSRISLVLVPQANLTSKVKPNGKSIQYHGQIAKARGEELYNFFCNSILQLALEHQARCRGQTGPSGGKLLHKGGSSGGSGGCGDGTIPTDPSIPPDQLFRQVTISFKYGSWDETTGLPLTDAQGGALTKSATKRIKKQYDAQVKRHEKYIMLQNQNQQREQEQDQTKGEPLHPSASGIASSSSSSSLPKLTRMEKETKLQTTNHTTEPLKNTLDTAFLNVVCGTFGKRQGLSIISDMGPFCHVVQL